MCVSDRALVKKKKKKKKKTVRKTRRCGATSLYERLKIASRDYGRRQFQVDGRAVQREDGGTGWGGGVPGVGGGAGEGGEERLDETPRQDYEQLKIA